MFIDNKPYGVITICDCCNVPIDDDAFDYSHKWVNHLHPECIYSMLDIEGNFPDFPIYFNHEYKEQV